MQNRRAPRESLARRDSLAPRESLARRELLGWAAAASAATAATALPAASADTPNRPAVDLGVRSDSPTSRTGSAQPIVGLIDAHAHLTACVAFGGDMRCGTPIGDISVAMRADATHTGIAPGSLLEAILGGTDPMAPNTQGWPHFTSWPAHNSQLHEQAYYRCVERAWRAGLRVINTLLVSNRVLTELYHPSAPPVDEMAEIRAQARYVHTIESYIDHEHGGAGRGWFRIATTPEQVRDIAAAGKLAVVLGVENSELFGGRVINGVAQCTAADVDAGLDELVDLGVSNAFPIHKFDNAFGGTRFDKGSTGAAINIGNLISTGRWWQAESAGNGPADNTQPLASDALVALLRAGVPGVPAGTLAPVYPDGPIRNTRGLTQLGRHLITGMMDRGMIINIDHMGVKTASAVLTMAEVRRYQGVMSAHTWADRTINDRCIALSGFTAGYAYAAHDAGNGEPDFLTEWHATRSGRHSSRLRGYGYGSDVNGLAPQAPPRLDARRLPLRYPFTAPDGTRMTRMRMGTRTYDLNTDGVAHYGLYADWYADILSLAGRWRPTLHRDLINGAEAFVSMWEGARANAAR